MTAPTAPTLLSIATEGLNLAGDSSPATALLARAEGEWMEQIKNDIWRRCKSLKSLLATSGAWVSNEISSASMPSDYAGQGEISLTLLEYFKAGLAQSASSNSITFSASETASESFMLGKEVVIISGVGVNQIVRITGYDEPSKTAAIAPNWTTVPSGIAAYAIIEKYWPLTPGPVWDYEQLTSSNIPQRPCKYYPVGDTSYGQFIFDHPTDKAYALRFRYPANIMTLDLASAQMATLYYKYRNVWIMGVFARRLKDLDDSRQDKAQLDYASVLSDMIAQETYGQDIHNLQATVSD